MPLQGLLGRRRIGGKQRRSPIPIQHVIIVGSLIIVALYAAGLLMIVGKGHSVAPSSENQAVVEKTNAPMRSKVDGSVDAGSNGRFGKDANPATQPVQMLSSTTDAETIGWAVTITGCGSDPITEGAAVLKHAVHLTSIHGNGRYNYKMYAIYHPDGEACALTLKDLGYELIQRETPVAVKDIEGKFLREKIESNGCCGEKELVKLEAYTLTEHPVVVHLDLDVVVLKPMDALFDMMMAKSPDDWDTINVPIMWPEKSLPEKVNAFFTRDYNMVGPGRTYKPVQGGFLVLRPDMKVYEEFVRIIKKGIDKEGTGWGGIVGPFYGFMTFQGLIPYYYDVLHDNEAIELSRCIYNQMADNPKDKRTINDIPQGRCRTNQEECEDCRNRPLEDVVSAHFTLCQKPWLCLPQDSDIIQLRLCRKLHHQWYRIRSDLEQSWGREAFGNGTYQKDHFFGFCTKHGKLGYLDIEKPYGAPIPK
ncbi:unnamed protein product [Cylindrotheca closterium]|uniref:Uncharacterized protein n=1 Tax=Cylindrotheca closterium TaxID=2856 RepID=A0AAD2FNL9_9STRA|nr:unnamed protein product [Cylindrotheca closterium]